MKKYIHYLVNKGRKIRNWGLASRIEHRRIKGNQKKKKPKRK